MSATGEPLWHEGLNLAPKSCLVTVFLTQKLNNNFNREKMQACMLLNSPSEKFQYDCNIAELI